MSQEKWVSSTLEQATDQSYVSHSCQWSQVEKSPLIGPLAQRASLDWLRVGKGEKTKMTQTSLCCQQERPKLGGTWLGDLKIPRGRNFPAKLVTHMGCVGH